MGAAWMNQGDQPPPAPARLRPRRRPPAGVAGMVREFHQGCDLPLPDRPTLATGAAVNMLRIDLIREEALELAVAVAAGDLVAVADGLADLAYVTYGAALTWGIDLDGCVAEVHRSNMTKLAGGAPVLRSDGKVLKGPAYSPPDLVPVLYPRRPR